MLNACFFLTEEIMRCLKGMLSELLTIATNVLYISFSLCDHSETTFVVNTYDVGQILPSCWENPAAASPGTPNLRDSRGTGAPEGS